MFAAATVVRRAVVVPLPVAVDQQPRRIVLHRLGDGHVGGLGILVREPVAQTQVRGAAVPFAHEFRLGQRLEEIKVLGKEQALLHQAAVLLPVGRSDAASLGVLAVRDLIDARLREADHLHVLGARQVHPAVQTPAVVQPIVHHQRQVVDQAAVLVIDIRIVQLTRLQVHIAESYIRGHI